MDILIEEFEESLLVASLEKGRLEGLEVDPAQEEVRWGSIYYARVKTLDPALDAAFLDLDGENIGIIYNQDLRLPDGKSGFVKGGDVAISKSLQPGQMVAVQAKSTYLPRHDGDYLASESKIVQLSMDITFPGRYLIYAPKLGKNRISQRIREKPLREQIKSMMGEMTDTKGFIVRASAAGTQTDILLREAKLLQNIWDGASEYFTGDAPQLIMRGPNAISRTLSDHASKRIDSIEVVTMDHMQKAEEWCELFAPDLMTKIEPIELNDATEDLALFYERDIIGQIESLFDSYVLMSGMGNIIIQKTAALTAIDVNKGGDKRSHLAVNIDAAQEIGRQLRLRNIGGIIVVDFLKFQSRTDEGKILAALEKVVLQDPCTVQIHGKTALGLIEITRKRRTPPLEERMDPLTF